MAYNKREVFAVVVAAVLACMVVAEATITCSTVTGDLAQCVPYLEGKASEPSHACCSGVQSLYTQTEGETKRDDRVDTCNCIKKLAAGLGSSLQSAQVTNLPGRCGVNLGYSISASTNCATIN